MTTNEALLFFSKTLGKPFYDSEKYYRESESMFKLIYDRYENEYEPLRNKVVEETDSSSFSLLPASAYDLDYYSPFHDDLYIWGAKRGKMAKRITPNSRIGSEYLYNKLGHLICVKTQYSPKTSTFVSFLIYEPSKYRVLSLCYRENLQGAFILDKISIFTYNKDCKMVLAERCDAFYYHNKDHSMYTNFWSGIDPVKIEVEINGYDGSGQLQTIVFSSYSPVIDGFSNSFESLKGKIIDSHACTRTMIRDVDGYLSKYKVRDEEYRILGGKKKVRDVPQLPNLDRIFANQS